MKGNNKNETIWKEGSFIERITPSNLRKKMKTFDKEDDTNLKFKCRKCNKRINAHHKDRHDEMCNECFNKIYFKEQT